MNVFDKNSIKAECYSENPFDLCTGLFLFGLELLESAMVIKDFNRYKEVFHNLTTNPSAIHDFQMESIVDNFKIITFFENYCKAQLILNGYVVHNVGNQNQQKHPVNFIEWQKKYKSTQEAIEALKDKTITISAMLEPEYQKIIGLPKDIILAIKRINENRNELHFLKSVVVLHSDRVLSEIASIKRFAESVRSISQEHQVNVKKELLSVRHK